MKRHILSRSVALAAAMQAGVTYSAPFLEEIVVTAQKREQSMSDVSLSVSAFTGETMRALNFREPRDLTAMVANMDIKGTQGDINPAVTIRGIGLNNFNANNNPTVGIYVDEVFLSSAAMMTLMMLDVERLEVLKGPQGTLYGRNSSGGAINIHSKRPTQELDGFVDVSFGNYDTFRVEGGIGGPLTDNLSGRISGLYDDRGESFHENRIGKDFDGVTNGSLRGQLQWDTERLTANLNLTYSDQDGGNQPGSFLQGLYDPVTFGPCTGSQCIAFNGYRKEGGDDFKHDFDPDWVRKLEIDTDLSSAIFRFDYDFDAVRFTSITGYITQDRTYGENFWSTPGELFAAVHEEEIDQFSQEFRFSGNSDNINWIAGVFYSDDQFESENLANSEQFFGDPLVVGLPDVFWDVDQETTSWAAYGNIDWLFGERWTLSTGIRYTDEEVKFAGGTTLADGAELIFPLTGNKDKFTDDNVSYRLALEYRPTDELLLYGSYTTGFKSGGYTGDFTTDPLELEAYDSEEVDAFELGTKYTFAGGMAQLDAAVFYYDYQDIQTTVPAANGLAFPLSNMDSADIWGIDFELTASPLEGLDFRVGAGYLDTEINDKTRDPASGALLFKGNELPNSPEVQVFGLVRYEFSLTSNLAMALQADAKYTDETFKEATNSPLNFADDYTVVNGRISVLSSDGAWEVAAWGRNLTDEEYYQEVFSTPDSLGIQAGFAGAPRTYGLSFIYNIN
jgi:iron complex outermembrane receptor protein